MVAAFVFAALVLAGADQASSPSFECSRSTISAERVICGDPGLGRLDRQVAGVYARVRTALPTAARQALTQDQRWFLGARDEWQRNSARGGFSSFADLSTRLRDRVVFLNSINTKSSASLLGTWINAAGELVVRAHEGGRVSVEFSAAHPVNARWLCELTGTGQVTNRSVTIEADQGWQVRLYLHDGYLVVEEEPQVPPPEGLYARPYCGANGYLEGTYFLRR